MRTTVTVATLAMLFGLAGSAAAQDTHAKLQAILDQMQAQYPAAKATADGTDLVAAGAVLVLQKDNLLMNKVDLTIPAGNTYKNGAISSGLLGALNKFSMHMPGQQGGDNTITTRMFVSGEKFWVTKITVSQDSVEFFLMSDPIKEQRYHSMLRFPYPKGTTPSPEEMSSAVAEVLKVDGDSGGGAPAQAAQGQGAGGAAGSAAPVETKRVAIAIGQTRDQVIASFGVPAKVVQLGKKEIDYFPDMKVTFVQNKVSDVN